MIDLTQRVSGYTYSHAEVLRLLQYQYGTLGVSFGCDVVRNGVRKRSAALVEGTVNCGALDEIKLTASITIQDDPMIDWLNDLLRPCMRITTPHGVLTYPLGVYVPSSPKGAKFKTVECYDRTVYLQEDGIDERLYFPADTKYTAAIQQLVSGAGILQAMILPSDAVMLSDREDWETGTKKLTIVNQLLAEMNYRSLETNFAGVVLAMPYAEPSARAVSIEYSAGVRAITMTGAKSELDSYNIPNVFKGVVSNPDYENGSGAPEEFVYTYINDSPANKLSTARRGRRIMAQLIRPDNIASQEALEAYVRRVAIDNMTAYEHITFSTANMPYHGIAEVLGLSLTEVSGVFAETAWSMPLSSGAAMGHSARRLVVLA